MPNSGNNGAVQFVREIQRIVRGQTGQERMIDFGVIKGDYSLVTDSFPVSIPRGEWSMVRQPSGAGMEITPGQRVIVVWAGNEAVVLGSVARL